MTMGFDNADSGIDSCRCASIIVSKKPGSVVKVVVSRVCVFACYDIDDQRVASFCCPRCATDRNGVVFAVYDGLRADHNAISKSFDAGRAQGGCCHS